MNEFEKTVRKALIDHDMTAGDLAEDLGITPSYLCDILKGNRPAPKVRKAICERLELDEQVVSE